MKYLFIITFLLMSTIGFTTELQWVDEQIQAIKPPRSTISKSIINKTKSPFIFLNKEKKDLVKSEKKARTTSNIKAKATFQASTNQITKKTTSYSLEAIINKSALINGNWYKLKSKVGKYILRSIDNTTVILSFGKKELFLSTRNKNHKIKFKNN